MKKSKWPDFLLTVAFRFIGGMILGIGLGVFCTYRVILRSFAHNHKLVPVVIVGVFGFVGGIIAVCQTPYWQRPWYKGIDRDEDKRMAKAFLSRRPQNPPPEARIDLEQ